MNGVSIAFEILEQEEKDGVRIIKDLILHSVSPTVYIAPFENTDRELGHRDHGGGL